MNHDESRIDHTEKGQEKCPLPEWLATRLDIPSDVWTGGMRIEIRGRHSAVVHGCRKIVEYRPDQVRLQMKSCFLLIKGHRLTCVSYLAGAVELEGQIDEVCFEEERRP